MSHIEDNAQLWETAEKPVREQLKKASIAGLAQDGPDEELETEMGPAETVDTSEAAQGNGQTRVQRKRIHEELERRQEDQAQPEAVRRHTRKRSRDCNEDEDNINNGRKVSGDGWGELVEESATASVTNGEKREAASKRPSTADPANASEAVTEAIASPKSKRSRLHVTNNDENGALVTETATSDVSTKADSAPTHGTTKIPSGSRFPNTSVVSPFGALAGSKSPAPHQPQTSQSAFAAKPKESTSSTFGGALGQESAFSVAPATSSAFGSGASGFGKIGASSGSAFGGTLGSSSPFGAAAGGGLSSFASGKPSASLSTGAKSAKPFGAPADPDDGEADEGNEDENAGYQSQSSSRETLQADKKDERFYEQHFETGEEEEETAYSCRAKLFNFATLEDGKKEWRDRGLGMLRLNVKRGEDGTKARFLMRADGSHRVILNTPVKKEIKFGAADGGPPTSGLMLFMGTIDGKTSLEMLQLKIKQQFAHELYDMITSLQAEM